MSQEDKLAAFGQWLTERTIQYEAMLFSACANTKMPVDGVRLQYGKLEALKYCLQAFSVLFNKDIQAFNAEFGQGEPEDSGEIESPPVKDEWWVGNKI